MWAILALIVISTVISTLYRQASERGFDSLLSAHLFNLIGSVGVTDAGALTGSPDLGDLRFSEPNSGWYWSVEPVSGGLTGELRSISMTEADPVAAGRRGAVQSRISSAATPTDGIAGEELEVFESEFVLDTQEPRRPLPRDGQPHRAGERDRQLPAPARSPISSLFGVGMIAINAVAILLGLQPLRPGAQGAGAWCARARRSGSTAASRPRSSRSPTRPMR